ncbi:MAG TPA: hypothetical protein VIH87_12985 [Methylocella sp.]
MGDQTELEQEKDQLDPSNISTGRKRERSLIEFPYTDLERTVELAGALHATGGQSKIDLKQLAVALDQSAMSGTFRAKLSAAKMFGLVNVEHGTVSLTSLGLKIIDETTSSSARVEAFLCVALYKEMFDRYNGYALPPPAAIERQMETLGVPRKQKERARQVFSTSAADAGFIAQNGRFSKPAAPPSRTGEDQSNDGSGEGSGGGRDGGKNQDDQPINRLPSGVLLAHLDPNQMDEAQQEAVWTLLKYFRAKGL